MYHFCETRSKLALLPPQSISIDIKCFIPQKPIQSHPVNLICMIFLCSLNSKFLSSNSDSSRGNTALGVNHLGIKDSDF